MAAAQTWLHHLLAWGLFPSVSRKGRSHPEETHLLLEAFSDASGLQGPHSALGSSEPSQLAETGNPICGAANSTVPASVALTPDGRCMELKGERPSLCLGSHIGKVGFIVVPAHGLLGAWSRLTHGVLLEKYLAWSGLSN